MWQIMPAVYKESSAFSVRWNIGLLVPNSALMACAQIKDDQFCIVLIYKTQVFGNI